MARCLYSSSNMSRLQQLRVFVRERLSAAAEEIFCAVERTILELQREAGACTPGAAGRPPAGRCSPASPASPVTAAELRCSRPPELRAR